MIPSLMFYGVVISGMLAGAAWGFERLTRGALGGTRFAWAAALAGSLGMVALAPVRSATGVSPEPAFAGTAAVPSPGLALLPGDLLVASANALPTWSSSALAALWAAGSIVALALLVAGYARHRRQALDGTPHRVDDTPVRVTDSVGPAVVGVRPPWIVLPRWLLSRADEEQRLVVRHERAHVEAGDPALLLGACAIVAAMPWNPVAWFALARLRLAMELDCDRRLLREGISPRAYGTLLIDLTSAMPATRVGALAFACRPSDLERRIVAMTARPLDHRRTRAVTAAAFAALALLAACEADLPTGAEIEAMGVEEFEERVGRLRLPTPAESTILVLDGVVVERRVLEELPADRIAAVEVQRTPTPRLLVSTRRSGDPRDEIVRRAAEVAEREIVIPREAVNQPLISLHCAEGCEIEKTAADGRKVEDPSKLPLVLLDGEVTTIEHVRRLRGGVIKSIGVVKGEEAKARYAARYGSRAANGVVEVSTKEP